MFFKLTLGLALVSALPIYPQAAKPRENPVTTVARGK